MDFNTHKNRHNIVTANKENNLEEIECEICGEVFLEDWVYVCFAVAGFMRIVLTVMMYSLIMLYL